MEVKNYVQGEWVSGKGKEINHFHAITGEHISSTSSEGIDYKAILEYGRDKGSSSLRKMTFQQRGEMLKSLALYLLKRKEVFYELSKATGATKIDSWIDIEGGIGNLFANASLRRQFPDLPYMVDGSTANLSKNGSFIGHHIMVPRRGVAVHINAFNFPIWGMLEKIAVNLMAGVPAVVKPSEFTSASSLEFMELVNEAGFPKGVVNCITGYGLEIGAAMVEHSDVAKVAFTGSDFAGQKIYETAAKKIMPVTLELGGKSPNIVFEDADFEAAVMGAISGIFAATGQTCIAGSRLLVQRKIHDKFVKRLVEVASEAKIGDPMSVETHVGPVTTAPQYDKILQYIKVAEEDGAKCVLGGKPYTGDGVQGDRFVEPTIFTGVTNNMRIAQEEVFGPILSVIPFDTEEDAIRIGNDIVFGLAAGVWTSDLGRAFRMSEKLKAGTVWVNTYRAVSFMTPFGGYKRSGQGRESGQESIKEFMQVKSVWIAQQTTSSNPFIMQ